MTVWSPGDPDMPEEVRELLERLSRPKSDKPLPALKVPPPLPVGSAKLYTMKITLLDVEPPVWRRFVAPSFMKLHHFHGVLQAVMGWEDGHMYAFTVDGKRFTPNRRLGVDAMWNKGDGYPPEKYELCQLIKPGMTFHYEYDFGDGWEHEIVVENDTASKDTKHPFYCIEGERACPPDDCGGPRGYKNLLDILSDPDNPEYEERLDWIGGRFDSECFDPDDCNRSLQVRRPASMIGSNVDRKVLDKKKKQERKRKDAAKKRNRKK